MAIQSFSDKNTEDFFISGQIRKGVGWIKIANIVQRKLDMLHYADQINDLRSPPGNRLEELEGNMKDFYSIRVNDRWRIVFRWISSEPCDIRIEDYH